MIAPNGSRFYQGEQDQHDTRDRDGREGLARRKDWGQVLHSSKQQRRANIDTLNGEVGGTCQCASQTVSAKPLSVG